VANVVDFRPEAYQRVVRYKGCKVIVTYNPNTKLFEWQATILMPKGLYGSSRTAKQAEQMAKKCLQEFMDFHGLG